MAQGTKRFLGDHERQTGTLLQPLGSYEDVLANTGVISSPWCVMGGKKTIGGREKGRGFAGKEGKHFSLGVQPSAGQVTQRGWAVSVLGAFEIWAESNVEPLGRVLFLTG